MLGRLKMFMPSNTQDNANNLASIEAFNAALDAQAGVADHVFQQLCAHTAVFQISDLLAKFIGRSDIIYPGKAGEYARSNDLRSGGKQMRITGRKALIANKMGTPSEGRLANNQSLPKGHLYLGVY